MMIIMMMMMMMMITWEHWWVQHTVVYLRKLSKAFALHFQVWQKQRTSLLHLSIHIHPLAGHLACKVLLATTPNLNVWGNGSEDPHILNVVDGGDRLASHTAALSCSGTICYPVKKHVKNSWDDAVLLWNCIWCPCLELMMIGPITWYIVYNLNCPGL